jgi:mRNA interferase RelE/StbE
MYRVEVLPSAAKELAKLDRPTQQRVAAAIDRLVEAPRDGAVKLRGSGDIWRVRVGDYRILYQVEDAALLVLIIRVAYRREAYR